MNQSDVLFIAAVAVGASPLLTLLASLMQALTKVVQTAISLAVSLVIEKKGIAERSETTFIGYLTSNHRWFSLAGDTYFQGWEFVKPVGERRNVWFHQMNTNWRIVLYKGAPIILVAAKGGDNGHPVACYYLRGTVNFENILLEAEVYQREYWATQPKATRFSVRTHSGGGFEGDKKGDNAETKSPDAAPAGAYWDRRIYKSIGWKPEDLGQTAQGASTTDLSLRRRLQACLRDIRFWHDQRDWHVERGMPWRRGYLFYGPPGTGKTSFVRAIGEEFDMPVDIFDLASMSNNTFAKYWNQVRANEGNKPHIVLFEDFDAVFEGRRNKINPSFGVTFDRILNTIDGIEREDGLLLVITTNHLHDIDPAMGIPDKDGRSTRPGRIDKTVYFNAMDAAGRAKMAARIIREPHLEAEVVCSGLQDTPAQFQERCRDVARSQLWGQAPADDFDLDDEDEAA